MSYVRMIHAVEIHRAVNDQAPRQSPPRQITSEKRNFLSDAVVPSRGAPMPQERGGTVAASPVFLRRDSSRASVQGTIGGKCRRNIGSGGGRWDGYHGGSEIRPCVVRKKTISPRSALLFASLMCAPWSNLCVLVWVVDLSWLASLSASLLVCSK